MQEITFVIFWDWVHYFLNSISSLFLVYALILIEYILSSLPKRGEMDGKFLKLLYY